MWPDLLLLLGGLALLVKGGELFVSSSVRIAEFLDMPRVVIGSTLVALATTSPELVVSIMSGIKGESGLAVGNAVGSCICNIGLILGVTAAFKHIDVHPRELRTPLTAMFVCGGVLLVLTLDLTLSRWQGLLLIAGGIAYFIHDFRQHARDTDPGDIAEARAIEQEQVAGHPLLRTKGGTAALFSFGAVLVVIGSKLLVDGAVSIATELGVPSIVIGLSIVAVGTSLPELVTAITSARQNVSDLAVGNILGANIANLTLIVGSAASIKEVTMSRTMQMFNFPALLLAMGLMLHMLLSDRRVTRREGAFLLGFYGLYLSVLIVLTVVKRGGL
jgi:cation:H+ antiporter